MYNALMKFVVSGEGKERERERERDAFREIDEKPLSDANEADVKRGSYGVQPLLFEII